MPEHISNWSRTKNVLVSEYLEPETIQDLKKILSEHNGRNRLSFCGSKMSPNGIGLETDVLVSMRKLNRIISIDPEKEIVIVQPGVKIENLLEDLNGVGLTLLNVPATTGMTIGGLIQTGSHGTGKSLPTMDETVTKLKFLNSKGDEVELTSEDDGDDFHAAKCALGTFGPITEITVKCVPKYFLKMTITVMKVSELVHGHKERLERYKHVKYHHIPHTGHTVVYTYEETEEKEYQRARAQSGSDFIDPIKLKGKLLELLFKFENLPTTDKDDFFSRNKDLSFADLRGRILAINPLSVDLIKELNKAELEFWKHSQGETVDESHKLLIFDCGGKQHVREFAFRVRGTNDVEFAQRVMALIEEHSFPAPAPIEQRWSRSSRSKLSPVFSPNPYDLFTWAGIIMYLVEDQETNEKIGTEIENYYCAIVNTLGVSFELNEHLGKIYISKANLRSLHERHQRRRRDFEEFHQSRRKYDNEDFFLLPSVKALTSEPKVN